MEQRRRRLVATTFVGIFILSGAGAAVAGVSDGGYRPARQHCSGHADDTDRGATTEDGCRSAILSVSDGKGNEPVWTGTQQTPDGTQVHQADTHADPKGVDPTSGAGVYFGADDNLDSGEHDSASEIGDGPSDGGAIQANVDPASLPAWIAALKANDSQYLLTHPIPLIDGGAGGCADGICVSVQSQRRIAYQGGGTGERDAADYTGKTWDPESCGGPSADEASCGPGGILAWHDKEGTVYVEPGVQIYEDPNPEGSPIGPYPLPGAYVGTCGVTAGGGTLPAAPASPVTNGAGQVAVHTGC